MSYSYSLDVLDMMESQTDKIEILNVFTTETQSHINELYEKLKNKDLDQISFLAHKLKTSIKLFQIEELYPSIDVLENESKNRSSSELEEKIDFINKVFQAVEKEIKNEIG
ncbi:Hpt domain-containing protein [Brumimicrobium oceani]|uniref:HPt domain-containing protein n=1 Tax=Brumimicrobium oceani TaxID=2100725 RepID=A0A2U2XG73_9FLAO|nr:Hpt domain-containing protein [Brumimicrobium oceani]PWH86809.1 hypothetical protein DIT68_00675 [Brumimicrobium oceani]